MLFWYTHMNKQRICNFEVYLLIYVYNIDSISLNKSLKTGYKAIKKGEECVSKLTTDKGHWSNYSRDIFAPSSERLKGGSKLAS